MSELENITKYLLNYLFKRIDDLTNELLHLKLNEGAQNERKRLAKEAEELLAEMLPAFKNHKPENDEDKNDDDDDNDSIKHSA